MAGALSRPPAGPPPESGQDGGMDTPHAKKNPVRQGVLDDVVGYHVARARVTTQAMFLRHVGQPLELRPVDYSLLMLLDANTRLTPKQLAQALALSAPNLTIMLDRMQERGLIERRPHPTDRRVTQLFLTLEAVPLLEVMRSMGNLTRGEAMADFSAEEQQQLFDLLSRMREHLLHACDQPVDASAQVNHV